VCTITAIKRLFALHQYELSVQQSHIVWTLTFCKVMWQQIWREGSSVLILTAKIFRVNIRWSYHKNKSDLFLRQSVRELARVTPVVDRDRPESQLSLSAPLTVWASVPAIVITQATAVKNSPSASQQQQWP